MQNNKDKKKLGFYGYGAKDVAGEGVEHKGFSYKTATSLIENIIAKTEERSLFSEIEAEGQLAVTTSSQKYVDRKGKRVTLSPIQMKLVTAFAEVIDTIINPKNGESGYKEYVKQLPSKMEDRGRGTNGITSKLPNSVKAVIDINDLTKLMYSTNRVGGKQADKVREEIKKLSEIRQIFKFKDDRGGTLTIESPIITMGKVIKYETKNGVIKLNKVELYFEDVFVYEINDRYSLSPITLLKLWNDTGVQTELFTMLLFLLQSVRGNYITHAHRIAEAKRKELLKAKKNKEEIKAEVEALKKSKLTYKESIASILERIDSKKYIDKGKYLNRVKIDRDLKQATEALISMGIITEYYESIGSSGNKVCNFVINDKWLSQEAEKIKQLLPKEAADRIQEAEEIKDEE